MPAGDRVSAAQIQESLRGISYPAKKEDLVSKARENGADENVIQSLEALTEQQFGGPQDVMKSYGGDKS